MGPYSTRGEVTRHICASFLKTRSRSKGFLTLSLRSLMEFIDGVASGTLQKNNVVKFFMKNCQTFSNCYKFG